MKRIDEKEVKNMEIRLLARSEKEISALVSVLVGAAGRGLRVWVDSAGDVVTVYIQSAVA